MEGRDGSLRDPSERTRELRKAEQKIYYLKQLFHYLFLLWAKCKRSGSVIFLRLLHAGPLRHCFDIYNLRVYIYSKFSDAAIAASTNHTGRTIGQEQLI